MEMCYDGALVMPSNYAVMDEREMEYLEGGVSLPMTRSYLDKNTCKSVGAKYSASTGLSQMRIAKEVYAHAVMYYASSVTMLLYYTLVAVCMRQSTFLVMSCLGWIRSHANPVDIGGDSAFRVGVYEVIWNIL